MLYSRTPDDLRQRRLIVAGITTALLLIAVVTYAVLVHQGHHAPSPSRPETQSDSVEPAPVEEATRATRLPALRPTSDPESFARQVAEALFAWDTATLVGRDDHIEQLIRLGDPTGESTVGLLADLGNYLPTRDAWVELTKYATRQWLSLDTVSIPTKWAEAQAQAGDALLPGTTAYTIHGTRHRTGVWAGEPVSSEHAVAFTVFIVCGPSYPKCHLLRISELDNPLD
ncbi:hypothetical protein [Nocardioides sambongensis]|uniref:hypothetical protein n=1 Tax=Nocardioides sambongensis TaxID=2589074 RepID=UPI0011260105|nr:hypothetical protein [Nocardioides sambongensis]